MEINAGMHAISSIIPINSTSGETYSIQSDCNVAVSCIEELTIQEVSKSGVWCSMGLGCPGILMHVFIVPAFFTWKKK